MWVNITKIENSKFNGSKLLFFNIDSEQKFTILTSKVAQILKLNSINDLKVNDKIFIFKSFRNDRPYYFIKKVEFERV